MLSQKPQEKEIFSVQVYCNKAFADYLLTVLTVACKGKKKDQKTQLDGNLVRVNTRQPCVLTMTNLFHSDVTPNFHYSTETPFTKGREVQDMQNATQQWGEVGFSSVFFQTDLKYRKLKCGTNITTSMHAFMCLPLLCWHTLDFSIGLKSFLGRVESSHFFKFQSNIKAEMHGVHFSFIFQSTTSSFT